MADLEAAQNTGKEFLGKAQAAAMVGEQKFHSQVTAPPALSLPDDVLDGLIDDDLFQVCPANELTTMIQDNLQQEERRKQLLEALSKEDQVEASIYFASIGEKEDDDPNVAEKYKASKASEFSRAEEVWSVTMKALVNDAKEIEAATTKAFGSDHEPAKEAMATLGEAAGTIKLVTDEFNKIIAEQNAIFGKATSLADMKQCMNKLRQEKSDKAKDLHIVRKAIAILNGLLKKKVSGELRGVVRSSPPAGQASQGTTAEHPALLKKHFLHHVCIEKGSSCNCDNKDFTHLRPYFVQKSEFKTFATDNKAVPALISWLKSQKRDQNSVTVVLDEPKHYEPLQKQLRQHLGFDSFTKPYSVIYQEVLATIFNFFLQRGTAEYTSEGFLPFGVVQWFVPLEGSMLIVAVKTEAVAGSSFAEKAVSFLSMDPLRMSELVAAEGFFMKLETGCAGWCPPRQATSTTAPP